MGPGCAVTREDPLPPGRLCPRPPYAFERDPGGKRIEQGIRHFHDSVKLIKFADDTTLIGLISNNDESAYRREVDRLVSWCSGNNLELNAQKTVEMIVDFRKSTVPPPPPSVMDSPITSVESFRFLGTTITQDLKWEPTISSLIKKAQQRMYFLRQLRKAKLPAQMLVQFYTAIIESILTSSVTVWFAGATVRDKQRLQRIVRSAEEVIGRSLPSLQDLHFLLLPLPMPRRKAQELPTNPLICSMGLFWRPGTINMTKAGSSRAFRRQILCLLSVYGPWRAGERLERAGGWSEEWTQGFDHTMDTGAHSVLV
uniref:Alkylated DNA repair protein AlkB homologue 8 N-terminal domain-containing protein n=1 Tax=Knipowitschia caucasica TaxID=637954 RepID=A0AAV2K2D8_KNICA